MSELNLIRDLYPDQAHADAGARARVWTSVAAVTVDRRRWSGRGRPRWLLPAGGTAALAAAVAIFFAVAGTEGTVDAAAARVLHEAAAAARAGRSFTTLGPEQYLHTRSTSAYLSTVGLKTGTYSVMVPYVRDVWLRRDGTGWLHQTSGTPYFLSDRDRRAWADAGSPPLDGSDSSLPLQNTDGPTAPMASLDLPTDPDALYAKVQHDAAGFGARTNAEMFITVGDDLRENSTTPAQRAALFEVAARIPGISLIPSVTDAAGRPAEGVAIDDGENHERLTLLFDPQSRVLLGEEETTLAGFFGGYPVGTVIGRAAYLEQQVVDSVPASVVQGARKG